MVTQTKEKKVTHFIVHTKRKKERERERKGKIKNECLYCSSLVFCRLLSRIDSSSSPVCRIVEGTVEEEEEGAMDGIEEAVVVVVVEEEEAAVVVVEDDDG
jgi:hypothetical protein